MKRNEKHIYHHYVADPLFYKVRPFALFFLFCVLVAGLSIAVYHLLAL